MQGFEKFGALLPLVES